MQTAQNIVHIATCQADLTSRMYKRKKKRRAIAKSKPEEKKRAKITNAGVHLYI